MKHLLTLLLLVAAVVCYFVGFGEGIVPLIVLYLVFETAFWLRLSSVFRKRRHNNS